MTNISVYRVGIYCRLSQEDGCDESQSISAQKEILSDYVKKQGWEIVDIYADDGYTGTNFLRPQFRRMVEDIERGKINLVITKDLSRLGRNYVQSGYYLEEFFPEHNVRCIALNDNFDSVDEDSFDFMPFKNIINEWYAKDVSKKIRFSLDGKAKSGEPRNTVFPIFGYTYNEFYERVPDPQSAQTVRLIFEKYIEFASTSRVAKYLTSHKIYVPRLYNALKYGYNKAKILSMPPKTHTKWTAFMVREIITKDAYLGTYKTAQTKGISFKNKKRIKNENCYVFKNRYEPIVDSKVWEMANSLLRRGKSGSVKVEDNAFKGLIYCKKCKNPFRIERRRSAKSGEFECRYYCNNRLCNRSNSISKKTVEKIMLKEIEYVMGILLQNTEKLALFVNERKRKNNAFDLDKTILNAQNSADKVDGKIAMVINQYAEGLLPDSTYYALMESYKREKLAIEKEIESLKLQQSCDTTPRMDMRTIVEKISALSTKAFLNYTVLQKLIKRIEVDSERINGSKHRRLVTVNVEYYAYDCI